MQDKNITLSGSEKIGLISNLATMLTAGIPILEAVDSLLEDTKGNQRKILETLREDLIQGRRVWSTFVKFPQVFDKVTVSVIRASEEAGTLDITLKDLKETIRKQQEFNDKITSAMIYPAFIFVVFIGVFLVILLVVIPKIASVFGRLKFDLPLPTRILIFLSNLLIEKWLFVLIGVVVVGFLAVYLFRAKRNFFLNILFSLPLISTLITQIDITRFSRSLYLLLSSGIPIAQALELIEDVVVKKSTAKIIEACREMVNSGKNLSDGLRGSKGKIPTIMIKLIEAGEKTGSLDKSLSDIAEYFDYQVSNTLKTLIALVEPVMLVVIGVIVGGMMLSIIAPIYGLISEVGKVR
ncbi:MAG: type II secretion system F family protein [Patescibacteria group bacterium]